MSLHVGIGSLGGTVFLGGTLYPTANYGSVSLVVGFRGETLDTSAIIR